MSDFLHGVEVVELSDGVRPLQTATTSVIGIIGTAPDANAAVFPLGQPVLLANQPRKAADNLGATGTLPDEIATIYSYLGAAVIVIRVAEGADEAATLTNIVGNAAAGTGVHAFLSAKSETGVAPRIVIAPGFTHQRPGDPAAANPVVAALVPVLDHLRAMGWGDGPNTDASDAITLADDFSGRWDFVDPRPQVFKEGAVVNGWGSTHAAAAEAKVINENGFWWSASNQPLNIVGTSRPIGFGLSDKNSEANLMNAAGVTTIIREDGFRLWGNRTPGEDPLWAFRAVRRTHDVINDTIEAGYLWALDRPFSQQLLEDIVEGVNAKMREWTALGAVLGGRAWLDPELNTPASFKAGQLFVNYDAEGPAPMERLTFRAHRNDDYYETLVISAPA